MSQRTPRLAGLSEEGVLDELLSIIRHVLEDEGVPGRIVRRGWHEGHLTFKVQDWEVVNVKAGSETSYHRPAPSASKPRKADTG